MDTIVKCFFALNAVLYLALGVICAIYPEASASSVGLQLQGDKGMAEFIAVYGGLEFGIGIFFIVALLRARLAFAALLFSNCMYAGLVFFRGFALLLHGASIANGWNFFAIEIALALVSAFLILKFKEPTLAKAK